MIESILTSYNQYLVKVFDNNQFLIGMVTTALAGGFVYFLKFLFGFSKEQFKKHLTTTVELDSMNESYHKIMQYLDENNVIKKSRYLLLSNGPWGYEPPVLSIGTGMQLMKLFDKYCLVYVKQEENRERILYKMWITSLGRSHYIANELLRISKVKEDDNITVVIDVHNKETYRQRKEVMEHRFYVEAEHELYNIVKNFVESEEEYINKNIPYKLGVLLYGPPGTGKTSVIRAIAGEFDYKIAIVESFNDFNKLPEQKCIVIIDEIDMMLGQKRDLKDDTNISDSLKQKTSDLGDILAEVSLSEALKKLDGIITKHGIIVIATTNRPELLDAALLRPGRLGYQIKFDYIKPVEFESAVKKYYEVEYKLQNKLKKCTSAELMGAYMEGLSLDEFIERFTIREIPDQTISY